MVKKLLDFVESRRLLLYPLSVFDESLSEGVSRKDRRMDFDSKGNGLEMTPVKRLRPDREVDPSSCRDTSWITNSMERIIKSSLTSQRNFNGQSGVAPHYFRLEEIML
ncbi:hypothetical protein HAX54_018374 [Datura stramonium]|uniref:Uncharacterized protein n=1 Tax=Datura stramonium TaxID=4076 RepID=A0ABS8UM64_DATST|nr:hypothetical protein [Datura stramonium]